MRYKAVLFDFDYTLGDATEAIYAGFCHAFTAMGRPEPELEAVRRTVGLPVQDAYTQLTGDSAPENRARFYALFHPVARDLQARGVVALCPGARALLEAVALTPSGARSTASRMLTSANSTAGRWRSPPE